MARPTTASRTSPARLARAVAVAAALALAGGCASDVNIRGNAVDKEKLALIKPGAQTRAQVIELLGSPTNVSTFSKDTIYYISQKTRVVTYHKPEILSRRIIAITFDKSDRVADIKTYDLKDGKEVAVVKRETPTPGREFSLIQQLIGNIGKFEPSSER